MKFTPSDAQQKATEHLLKHEEAVLFMGTGLGKTAACLYAISELFDNLQIKGVLIVAPLRVTNLTWPHEVAKWGFSKRFEVANLRTAKGMKALQNKSAHIYVCNYEMLPKLAENYFKKLKTEPAFDLVVFDELTMAKNYKSKRIRSARPYFHRLVPRRWGLTGTPVPNGLLDLFGQILLIDGGLSLGISFHHYRNTFFQQADYFGYKFALRQGADNIIHERINNLALTLRREDYLKIPDMRVVDVEVNLPQQLQTDYKRFERESFLAFDNGLEVSAISAGALVQKLLQFVSGAFYNDESRTAFTDVHNIKVEALQKLLKKLDDSPKLIIYNFRHEKARLLKALPEAVDFSQAKNQSQEQDMLARWNGGKIKYLLAHPRSMAHGLNMQEGGYETIWFTPTYDRELYDQANARLARWGQKNETTVYRIVCNNTIDIVVLEALRRKDEEQAGLLSALNDYRNSR